MGKDRNRKGLPVWDKPVLTALGNVPQGHGDTFCRDGSSAEQCGNGSSPVHLPKCFDGSHPPSGSCGKGFGGRD